MDKNSTKVSLVVPCYNIASVCNRFFQSLLNQTYNNLEIILVNDGSNDNTEKILLDNKEKLEQRGFEVNYIYQENKGLGGAINTGLMALTGDYFCWADPDDYFMSTSFEERAKFLDLHKDYGIVTSDAFIGNGLITEDVRLISNGFSYNEDENQFMHLLNNDSIFCAGCHMIRTSAFLSANGSMDIYQCRNGQNRQILLPVYYNFKRYFIDKPLYYYVTQENSMSHQVNSFEKKMDNINAEEKIFIETFNRMKISNDEKTKYLNYALNDCVKRKILLCLQYDEYKQMRTYLKKYRPTNKKQFLLIKIRKHPIFNRMYKKIKD